MFSLNKFRSKSYTVTLFLLGVIANFSTGCTCLFICDDTPPKLCELPPDKVCKNSLLIKLIDRKNPANQGVSTDFKLNIVAENGEDFSVACSNSDNTNKKELFPSCNFNSENKVESIFVRNIKVNRINVTFQRGDLKINFNNLDLNYSQSAKIPCELLLYEDSEFCNNANLTLEVE